MNEFECICPTCKKNYIRKTEFIHCPTILIENENEKGTYKSKGYINCPECMKKPKEEIVFEVY